MSKGKRATQCMWGRGTPNACNRKTYDVYCWQHRDMNPPPAGASDSRFSYFSSGGSGKPAPKANLSVSSLDDIWSFVDLVSIGGESFAKNEKGLLDIAGKYVDYSTERLIEGEFPALDERAYKDNINPSWYAASFEEKITDLLRVRPVTLSVNDVEDIIKAEGVHELGGVNSRAGNSSIASYALRLAWEKAQLEGKAEVRSDNGLLYGSNYEKFVDDISPVYDKRVEDSFNEHFENWDQYILFLTNKPSLTSAGLSPRQRRELRGQGKQIPDSLMSPGQSGMGRTAPRKPRPHKPTTTPSPSPKREPSFTAKAAPSFAEWREGVKRERAARERQIALEEKQESIKRAKIEEVALANGYTYEEWERKKELDERHREILTRQREESARKNKGFFSLFR